MPIPQQPHQMQCRLIGTAKSRIMCYKKNIHHLYLFSTFPIGTFTKSIAYLFADFPVLKNA